MGRKKASGFGGYSTYCTGTRPGGLKTEMIATIRERLSPTVCSRVSRHLGIVYVFHFFLATGRLLASICI